MDLRWNLRLPLLRGKFKKELENTQWLSPIELEKLQIRRMRRLIKHAYETVPYYHRLFDADRIRPEDVRSREDLIKLPVLKKEEVRTNRAEMVSSRYPLKELQERRTSGSTSIPLAVYWNVESKAFKDAANLRHRTWMSLSENDIATYLGPPGLNIYPSQAPEALTLYAWDVTQEKIARLVQNIRKLRPSFLWGSPAITSLLARFCEEKGISDITFKAILSGGDRLFDNEKKRLEEVFNSEVYQAYSASDTGVMAYDCAEHAGLHICSEYVFIEFLRDSEPAASGEIASVVVTPLLAYGMPLIRYDLEDAAFKIGDPCACGRGLPLMSYIDGRITDILVSADGRWLGNSDFHSRLFDRVDVQQYRLIQETVEKLVVELIPGKNYDAKAERFIVERIKKYMGQQVEVTVKTTDHIDPTPSGKRRIVTSHVPIKFH